ncbi:MAG TPA: tail fiber protein [Solimonas sp.]|nr:tail fiber protein [Solimonas sp.]
MADPFIAEVRIFPFNFAPTGWAFCDGQLLPLSQNTALFSLLGTTYGGNGKTDFALPDLQGRVPMHPGQGPGLSPHDLGESAGSEGVTLASAALPSHSHTLSSSPLASSALARYEAPASSLALAGSEGFLAYAPAGGPTMAGVPSQTVGGGLPHNNLMPYLTMNFCIALQGVFPPRSS